MADFEGAVIEIVERSHPELKVLGKTIPAMDASAQEAIAPNEIRINGQRLTVSSDYPVTVHEMDLLVPKSCVLVTLTLVAKRVHIFGEGPQSEEVDPDA